MYTINVDSALVGKQCVAISLSVCPSANMSLELLD